MARTALATRRARRADLGRRVLRTAAALASVWLLAAGSGAARAADLDAYVVRVPVDVTAESANRAREKALLQAQEDGLKRLYQRVAVREDAKLLPKVDRADLPRLVQSMEIQDERVLQVRYIARVVVRFAATPVRDRLRAAGVRFAETVARPLLVLPVWRSAEKPVLWDERHPWFAAWGPIELDVGLVPMLLPVGDLADVTELAGDAKVIDDPVRLAAIVQRYGAGEAMVLDMAMRARAGGGLILQLAGHRLGSDGTLKRDVLARTWQARDAKQAEGMLPRAAQETFAAIDDAWKVQNVLGGPEITLPVTVETAAMTDWIQVRERLSRVATLRRHQVTTMTRERAQVQLVFEGTPEQLALAAQQAGLTLAQRDGAWMLSAMPGFAGGPQRPAPDATFSGGPARAAPSLAPAPPAAVPGAAPGQAPAPTPPAGAGTAPAAKPPTN